MVRFRKLWPVLAVFALLLGATSAYAGLQTAPVLVPTVVPLSATTMSLSENTAVPTNNILPHFSIHVNSSSAGGIPATANIADQNTNATANTTANHPLPVARGRFAGAVPIQAANIASSANIAVTRF